MNWCQTSVIPFKTGMSNFCYSLSNSIMQLIEFYSWNRTSLVSLLLEENPKNKIKLKNAITFKIFLPEFGFTGYKTHGCQVKWFLKFSVVLDGSLLSSHARKYVCVNFSFPKTQQESPYSIFFNVARCILLFHSVL